MMSERNDDGVVGRRIVVKFGGTSLADGVRISKAAAATASEAKKGHGVVVIVSAMGKTTDLLMDITKQATNGGTVSGSDIDSVLAMGERTSARIFLTALRTCGVDGRCFDPSDKDWPIITNGKPTNADPILSFCEKMVKFQVLPLLEMGKVAVIPGFIGKTVDGSITTMGRGGSDTTALIVAHAIGASQVILVTDVEGIMTGDPKIIKSARKLSSIDINTLIGIADSGIKFIHKKALMYKDANIDVKVTHFGFSDLDADGTTIRGALENELTVDLAYPESVMVVTIIGKALSESPKVLHEVVQRVMNSKVKILGMSTNYDSIILYLPEQFGDEILEELHSVVINNVQAVAMSVRRKIAFIKVKGVGLEETPGVINQICQVLTANQINIFGVFTITSSVEIFVEMQDLQRALKAIRNAIGGIGK